MLADVVAGLGAEKTIARITLCIDLPVQPLGLEQVADLSAAVQRADAKAAEEAALPEISNIPPDEAGTEDISMEDLLGAGTRKQPVAAKEVAVEIPEVEHQTN